MRWQLGSCESCSAEAVASVAAAPVPVAAVPGVGFCKSQAVFALDGAPTALPGNPREEGEPHGVRRVNRTYAGEPKSLDEGADKITGFGSRR